MGRKVLLAGNDERLLARVRDAFAARDYQVILATDIPQAVQQLFQTHPDLVVIDAATKGPRWDGAELCHRIKAVVDLPVIALVPSDGADARVALLKVGADDALNHPVDMEELLLRARGLLRRCFTAPERRLWSAPDAPPSPGAENDVRSPDSGPPPHGRWTFAGGLWIDAATRCVEVGERQVTLTPREFQLLSYLVANVGRTLPHAEILEAVWGDDAVDTQVVRQFVRQLRQKIEPDPTQPRYILTHRGAGYRFVGA